MEKTLSINNLKVNYKIAGSGPVILVLHGWGSSSDSWVDVMEILSGRGYKVICPDFPGFGKSQPPIQPWACPIEWLTVVQETWLMVRLKDMILKSGFLHRKNTEKLIQIPTFLISKPAD
ncbi:unnamed protein product [marine sediment metagenome]|uniref:AB hydrolase-1 domain-containing protein n=1 Tax=marine sediment metagenome TaxID=412755 RepID=X1P8X9_9ZZZZ